MAFAPQILSVEGAENALLPDGVILLLQVEKNDESSMCAESILDIMFTFTRRSVVYLACHSPHYTPEQSFK